tara:strand:+ start:491 stop:694 length:204 start_codon:yes stop_codon:yes gene_type:complete
MVAAVVVVVYHHTQKAQVELVAAELAVLEMEMPALPEAQTPVVVAEAVAKRLLAAHYQVMEPMEALV